MAQVGIAAAANYFDATHQKTVIFFAGDVFFGDRFPETGPARARIELVFRAEQFLTAADANVDALLVIIPIFAGEGDLGPLLTGDLVLNRRQKLLPFFF